MTLPRDIHELRDRCNPEQVRNGREVTAEDFLYVDSLLHLDDLAMRFGNGDGDRLTLACEIEALAEEITDDAQRRHEHARHIKPGGFEFLRFADAGGPGWRATAFLATVFQFRNLCLSEWSTWPGAPTDDATRCMWLPIAFCEVHNSYIALRATSDAQRHSPPTQETEPDDKA